MWIIQAALLVLTVFVAGSGHEVPTMSLLTRKGKRWPELSKHPQRFGSSSPFQQPSVISIRDPDVAMDLFSVTGIHKKGARKDVDKLLDRNELFRSVGHLPSENKKKNPVRHHRRKADRHHIFLQDQSAFESETEDYRGVSRNNMEGPGSTPSQRSADDYDDLTKSRNEITEELATVTSEPVHPNRCKGSGNSKDSNCTSERNHFPSSVLMIEAHYNQTVRDFLQICTPVERVEISGVDDVQMLLNALFEQMTVKDKSMKASSIVLLFNLEHYANWTKEDVIEVLQASVTALRNGFSDMMIYSKFHQDGADFNDTHLTLTYDVKYWLSELCNQRLTPCADFASIILESVLQMNQIEQEEADNDVSSDVKDSLDDASSQANAWCQQLGLGPGSRIVDVRALLLKPTGGYHREETSLVLGDILPKNSKSYDKNRAPKFFGQPTIVYFHVTVLSIDTINEESMTYVADIFLAQSWRDHRLRLPEDMTEEYRILDVGWLQNIWRPDCFFKNAKKVTFHEMSVPNHYLWLYHDKTLIYMAKLTLVLSCAMKFENYPHDTQVCSMQIESLSHTTHDLVFKWNFTDPLVTNPDIELPQLDIAKNTTEDCTLEYSTGNFTCLAVVFNLRRRLGYHLFHTYIPSGLIVVMSWISFWIKPEAIPARATLGVTSLLTLSTQSTQSQRSLPPVSYVKAIDVWMSSCTVFVFMSLMEFAVVNSFMGPVATKPMKGYSEEDLSIHRPSGYNGTNSSLRLRGKPSSPARGPPPPPPGPQYVTFCNGREVALFIDQWSRLFFPIAFIILNLVYWITFLH